MVRKLWKKKLHDFYHFLSLVCARVVVFDAESFHNISGEKDVCVTSPIATDLNVAFFHAEWKI